jgi:hypothetical protein
MNPLRLGYRSLQRAALPPPNLPAGCRLGSPARAAAFFHATRRNAQISRPGRYGTAKKPPPHLLETGDGETVAAGGGDSGVAKGDPISEPPAPSSDVNSEPQKPDGEPTVAKPEVISLPGPSAKDGEAADPPTPSDGVLNVGKEEAAGSSTLPQLHPPPYTHHFDTWSLVRDLEKGGFTQAQAVTAMKAVRLLLTRNMDLARDALVSKSNVENVRHQLSEKL